MLKQYARLAKKNDDTLKYIHIIEVSSKPYDLMGDTVRMTSALQTAQKLYEEAGYHQEAVRTLSPIIYLNISRGNLDEARRLIDYYESESGLFDEDGEIAVGFETYYYFKGLYYLHTAHPDLAEQYMRRLLNSHRDNLNACRGLLQVYRQYRQLDSVSKYSLLFERANDSVASIKRTEAMHRMTSMYNYQRYQLTAERALRSTTISRIIVAFVLFMACVSLLIGYYSYWQYKKKKLAEISHLSSEYQKSLIDYNRVSKELELLKLNESSFIDSKKQEIEELKAIVIEQESRWQNISQGEKDMVLQNSDLVKLFHKKAGGGRDNTMPTTNQWAQLQDMFEHFMQMAYDVVGGMSTPLSPLELKACILILLKFANSEISVLLGVTPQRVSNMKSRINQKLFHYTSASSLEKNLKKALLERGLKMM